MAVTYTDEPHIHSGTSLVLYTNVRWTFHLSGTFTP